MACVGRAVWAGCSSSLDVIILRVAPVPACVSYCLVLVCVAGCSRPAPVYVCTYDTIRGLATKLATAATARCSPCCQLTRSCQLSTLFPLSLTAALPSRWHRATSLHCGNVEWMPADTSERAKGEQAEGVMGRCWGAPRGDGCGQVGSNGAVLKSFHPLSPGRWRHVKAAPITHIQQRRRRRHQSRGAGRGRAVMSRRCVSMLKHDVMHLHWGPEPNRGPGVEEFAGRGAVQGCS